jgi:hypothetical protein
MYVYAQGITVGVHGWMRKPMKDFTRCISNRIRPGC